MPAPTGAFPVTAPVGHAGLTPQSVVKLLQTANPGEVHKTEPSEAEARCLHAGNES